MRTKLAKAQIVLLLVSAALLILVGTSSIVSPIDFYRSNNIEFSVNVSLLNELKPPARLLLVAAFEATIGLTCLLVLLIGRTSLKKVV